MPETALSLLDGESEMAQVFQSGMALLAEIEGVDKIVSPTEFEFIAELHKAAKAQVRRIEEFYAPIKARERAVWQATVADEKLVAEPFNASLAKTGALLAAYEAAQRRDRAIAEARAAQEAKALGTDGPVVVPATIPPRAKVDGLSFRTKKVAVVVDRAALLAALAAGKVPDALWEPNQRMLDDMCKGVNAPGIEDLKEQEAALTRALGIPGVAVRVERITSTRS
jgi:uncharacterized protein YbjQ (UPF0145 family)